MRERSSMTQNYFKKRRKERLASRPLRSRSRRPQRTAEGRLIAEPTLPPAIASFEAGTRLFVPALSSASPRYKSEVVPKNGDSGGLILMIISRCRDRKANNNTL